MEGRDINNIKETSSKLIVIISKEKNSLRMLGTKKFIIQIRRPGKDILRSDICVKF